MAPSSLSSILLRIGLAFTFLYAAIASLLEPVNWVGFFPLWLRSLIPEGWLLGGFSAIEAILGLWLLSGKKMFFAGLLSAAVFLGITVFNLGALDIVFRDVGLFFAALALAFLKR